MIAENLRERLARIRLVILDNDGVLTDGRIVYGDYGDELKFYDIQDGMGLVLLRKASIPTVIISGRKSRVTVRRAKEMNVAKVYQNVRDKKGAFAKVCGKFRVKPEEVLFIGDDLVDLPIMTRCGFAAAVENAVPEVKERAHYVTERRGGRGAVREVTDLLLKAQGRWEELVAGYVS
ncbi:MAG: 3-deoxy-D-manno-octulosonate 8-phosphate phosphatase KdsC [Candidatus Omnitrophica bacterium]|nr:3-deoxy-D-manno-octulosonate 8-phosphate phosphatase KdsC [Candidatus Omnitrophota bacterium]